MTLLRVSVYLLLVYAVSVSATDLPECPQDQSQRYHNCYGTYRYESGNKYVGEWRDSKQHGQGTFYFAVGSKYVGEWRDGKRHGQGTFSYVSGNKYVGEYRNGKLHGQGIYYDSDGTVLNQGIWQDGEFIGSRSNEITEHRRDRNRSAHRKTSRSSSETQEVSSGTGFFISTNGHIVTNLHVCDGCQDLKVHIQGKDYPSTLIGSDRTNDLALLKISYTPGHVLFLSHKQLALMEDVYVAGYPFGYRVSSAIKITKGIVSSLAGIGDNYSRFQIDAAIQPGNSGGPVIDEDGNVVGVAVEKLDALMTLKSVGALPENTNFGIKVSVLENFLDAHSIPYGRSSAPMVSKKERADKISGSTVYISCWMTLAQIEQMRKQKVMFRKWK